MGKSEKCKAFANENRLKLLLCLSKAKTVSSLLKTCDLSQSALSQHLKILKDAGIVETKKQKKFIFYKIKNKKAVEIAKLLLNYK
jgi:DNA-binding transcriptional ArsR family regulator